MKRKLTIAGFALLGSFVLSVLANEAKFNYDLMTVFGLINFLLACLGIFVGLIMLLSRNRKNGLDLLAASGIVLLIGVGVCSAFPMNMRMM
jgi:hypothetical protein